MAKSYEISQSQLQEIEAARKKNRNKNVERRLYVLVMRAEGKSLEEISEKTGYGFRDDHYFFLLVRSLSLSPSIP